MKINLLLSIGKLFLHELIEMIAGRIFFVKDKGMYCKHANLS